MGTAGAAVGDGITEAALTMRKNLEKAGVKAYFLLKTPLPPPEETVPTKFQSLQGGKGSRFSGAAVLRSSATMQLGTSTLEQPVNEMLQSSKL